MWSGPSHGGWDGGAGLAVGGQSRQGRWGQWATTRKYKICITDYRLRSRNMGTHDLSVVEGMRLTAYPAGVEASLRNAK